MTMMRPFSRKKEELTAPVVTSRVELPLMIGAARTDKRAAAPRAAATSRDALTVANALHDFPGLGELWRRTRGDPAIRVAVLDGTVDLAHPGLARAVLTQRPVPGLPASPGGAAGRHGTRVAELIFGQPDGIARGCTGISLPIFSSDGARLRPCSQLDLAHALRA